MAFPICFFFVVIPWPTLFETPIIQSLTRANAATVIEVMGAMGIPAMQHGNLIEVGNGVVGIDEACSGIRSFQSSLMISLFLGEFFRLSLWKRLLLVPSGFLLSFVFNVVRTSFLTYTAAKKGTDAIAEYHDPAGLVILLACTVSMWLLALFLNRKKSLPTSQVSAPDSPVSVPSSQAPGLSSQVSSSGPRSPVLISAFSFQLSAFLTIWLLLVEAGVQIWYRTREANLPPSSKWTVAFPVDKSSYKDLPMAEKTKYLLRFDEGKQGAWTDDDGVKWQTFYYSWVPGRVAGYLAKRHTPDICMPAAGRTLNSDPELMVLNVQNLTLPVRRYLFETPSGPLHVFHCRWEAGAGAAAYVQQESARINLIRGIWAGRGKHGQKVLEIILSGVEDPQDAKKIFSAELQKLIKIEKNAQR